MSKFFKASNKIEDVSSPKSSYISKSGFYPVTVLAPIVNVSKNGSTTVDFLVDYENQKQVIYGGLRCFNNDGSQNAMGTKLFNQFLIVCGIEEVEDPIEMQLPVGKKGAMKTVPVLEDAMDVETIMRIQLSYSMWDGEIMEKRNIRGFYNAKNKASAEEMLSGENIGSRYEQDSKYANDITYEDGLTPEDISKWIAGGRGKGRGENATKTQTTAAPSFGKRRFGAATE